VTRAVELFPLDPSPTVLYAVLGGGAFANGEQIGVPESVKVPLNKAWVNLNHYGDVTYESNRCVVVSIYYLLLLFVVTF